jgi:hypothetical protein
LLLIQQHLLRQRQPAHKNSLAVTSWRGVGLVDQEGISFLLPPLSGLIMMMQDGELVCLNDEA